MTSPISELEKNYTIEQEIGRGAMGTVYLATDKRLERKVAIKSLSISSFNNDKNMVEELIQRFQREAKSVAKLSHPNIVTIHDFGQTEDSYYMVMEYLEGKSLDKILENKKYISSELVVNIGMQICNALGFAHQNGVIHRDIKPANIILSQKFIAKLTDFGIAQLSTEQKKLTQTGSLLGSIMYISPEQLQNSADIDNRADIYSLGITLYQLLTGVLPFDSNNAGEVIFKILKEQPKAPSTYNSDISVLLDNIILKAISKDPQERYQNTEEMAKELSLLVSTNINFTDTFLSMFSNNFDKNDTLKLSINNNFSKTIIKKTIIDQDIIKNLSNNYSWVENLIENWKTQVITKVDLKHLINKLIEPSLIDKAFTGVLVIDKNVHLFIYEGYFIGSININELKIGNEVFNFLPSDPTSLELKTPSEDELNNIAIISGILQNKVKVIQKNLDSSLVNLTALIDSINDEKIFSGYITCYTEDNIYYSGFYKGYELFCISLKNNEKVTLQEIILKNSLILNSYEIEVEIFKPNICNLLKNASVFFKYKDENKTKLYNIVDLENQEIPIHLIKEAKNNTYLEFNFNQEEKIKIFDKEINILNVLKNSIQYKFLEWLTGEYFYLLNSTGNITTLKYIYSWLPAIENISFFENLIGEDNKNYNFDIVFHGQVKNEGYKKILFLVRFGSGKQEDLNKFIEDSIQVKKKLIKSGDIGGVIYISENELESDSLKLFYQRTVEPRKGFGLGALDKLTKYKGFVRIGFGRGFHLNLIEYHKNNQSFNVVAPLLK